MDAIAFIIWSVERFPEWNGTDVPLTRREILQKRLKSSKQARLKKNPSHFHHFIWILRHQSWESVYRIEKEWLILLTRTVHCTNCTQAAAAAAVESHDHPLLVHTSAAAAFRQEHLGGKSIEATKRNASLRAPLTHCFRYLPWTGFIAKMGRFLSCAKVLGLY